EDEGRGLAARVVEVLGLVAVDDDVNAAAAEQGDEDAVAARLQDRRGDGVRLAHGLFGLAHGQALDSYRGHERQRDGPVLADGDGVAEDGPALRPARRVVNRRALGGRTQHALDPDAQDVAGGQAVDGGLVLAQQRCWAG